MAMTNEGSSSGITCMLLLPQLVDIWLPEPSEAGQEAGWTPPGEQAPRTQIPPLISFLEGLPDALTPDGIKCKKLLCGHIVSVQSILVCCNLFADAAWTTPHSFGCAEPDCNETLEFPKIPDPQVLDGVKARLDLIEWSFNKDPPTDRDRNTVSLLREILSKIGYSSQELEPEMDADLTSSHLSEESLTKTLVDMEKEAFSLMVLYHGKNAEVPIRGTESYCTHRDAVEHPPGPSQLRYPILSPGQDCECVTPHEYIREPSSWATTPAETEFDPNEPKDDKPRHLKTVRFVAPVVTQVQYFEPWWNDEYRDTDRYWSTGPHTRSTDSSTQADDEWEIESLEHHRRLEAQLARDLEGQESVDSAVFGSDEETLDGMEEDDEVWDGEILEDIEKTHRWFDEVVGYYRNLQES